MLCCVLHAFENSIKHVSVSVQAFGTMEPSRYLSNTCSCMVPTITRQLNFVMIVSAPTVCLHSNIFYCLTPPGQQVIIPKFLSWSSPHSYTIIPLNLLWGSQITVSLYYLYNTFLLWLLHSKLGLYIILYILSLILINITVATTKILPVSLR